MYHPHYGFIHSQCYIALFPFLTCLQYLLTHSCTCHLCVDRQLHRLDDSCNFKSISIESGVFFVINYSNINMKIAPLHLHWLHFATAQLEADISIVSFEVAEVANRCVKCILIANRLFTSFNHTHASVPS